MSRAMGDRQDHYPGRQKIEENVECVYSASEKSVSLARVMRKQRSKSTELGDFRSS